METKIKAGHELKSHQLTNSDWILWRFISDEIKIDIQDWKKYKVTYTTSDASDPSDFSETNCIYKISEVPGYILDVIRQKKKLDAQLDEYMKS